MIGCKKGRTQSVATKLRASGLQVLETYQCSDVFEGLTVISSTNQTKEEVQRVSGSAAKKIWNSVQYVPAAPITQPVQLGRRDLDPQGYSFLPFVNADKAHAAGYRGQGVKVGIIDSGIDFEHPAVSICSPLLLVIVSNFAYNGVSSLEMPGPASSSLVARFLEDMITSVTVSLALLS